MFKFFENATKMVRVHAPVLAGFAGLTWAFTHVDSKKEVSTPQKTELNNQARSVDWYQGPKV